MNRATLRPLRTRRFPAETTVAPARPAASRDALKSSPEMHPNTRRTLAAVGAVWLAFASSAYGGSPAESAPPLRAAHETNPLIVRGRYLVEHVGLCADCHSPRDEKGEFIPKLWMHGSALPFTPTVPMPWSQAAPPIAGLPGMTEEQAVTFLRTGKRPDGTTPRPPMPEFRFSAEDANAVVAYLKTFAK